MRKILLPVGAIVHRFSECEYVGIDVRVGLWVWTVGNVVIVEMDSSLKELRLGYPKRRFIKMRSLAQAYRQMLVSVEQCDAYLVAVDDVLSIELHWVSGCVTVIGCESHETNDIEGECKCKDSMRSQQETRLSPSSIKTDC